MRTTVTLDPDVAKKIRDLAHRKRASFKSVINDVLRRGLLSQDRAAEATASFVVTPHAGGFRPGLDTGKLNQLADELETGDFLREASRER